MTGYNPGGLFEQAEVGDHCRYGRATGDDSNLILFAFVIIGH